MRCRQRHQQQPEGAGLRKAELVGEQAVTYSSTSGRSASAAAFASPCQPSRSWAIGSTAHSAAPITPASSPHSARTSEYTDRIPITAKTQMPCMSTLAGWPPSVRYEPNTAGTPGSWRNG